MSNLLNMDNAFFTIMGKVWDMILLSIIWVLCSMTIVLIGPATTAMYYSVVKVIRRERGYVTREFFHSFKDNIKLGIITTIIFVILSYVMYIDFTYSKVMLDEGKSYGSLLIAGFIAITTVLVFILIFIFPILSRFTLNLKGLFKTAFIIAMKHFPTTFLLAIIIAVFALAVYLIYPAIFIAPALCCLVCSFLIERVFKKYMPKPEGTEEETGKDLWYWE